MAAIGAGIGPDGPGSRDALVSALSELAHQPSALRDHLGHLLTDESATRRPVFRQMMTRAVKVKSWTGFNGTVTVWELKK